MLSTVKGFYLLLPSCYNVKCKELLFYIYVYCVILFNVKTPYSSLLSHFIFLIPLNEKLNIFLVGAIFEKKKFKFYANCVILSELVNPHLSAAFLISHIGLGQIRRLWLLSLSYCMFKRNLAK